MRTNAIQYVLSKLPGARLIAGSADGSDDGAALQVNGLRIVASWGSGWDHVSVSLPTRCPTWVEMCHVKDLFWDDDECVIQYHPVKSEYVNNHPYCLHLWKPQNQAVPIPPREFVGIKDAGVLK